MADLRGRGVVPAENIFVVTANEYLDITKEQLPQLPAENVLGEPFRKNTAPCIAYISFKLQKLNPELRAALKKAGHLKRDPRAKERKKPGQPGARKRFQFSKR